MKKLVFILLGMCFCVSCTEKKISKDNDGEEISSESSSYKFVITKSDGTQKTYDINAANDKEAFDSISPLMDNTTDMKDAYLMNQNGDTVDLRAIMLMDAFSDLN